MLRSKPEDHLHGFFFTFRLANNQQISDMPPLYVIERGLGGEYKNN